MMAYGDRRDYPKIEIIVDGKYFATTTWSKTCRQAKSEFCKRYNISESRVKCFFEEER